MPCKPYPVKKATALLEEWIALRIPKSPDEAPITAVAAATYLSAKGVATHRATLYSKGLNALLVEGARRQEEEGGGHRIEEERRQYDAVLGTLREENRVLGDRNRALLGEIATIVFNARRCNVSEAELRRPLPPTDRSRSRAGTKSGRGRTT